MLSRSRCSSLLRGKLMTEFMVASLLSVLTVPQTLLFAIFLAMPEKFLSPYNPAETEGRIYQTWEESGFSLPKNASRKAWRKPTRRRIPSCSLHRTSRPAPYGPRRSCSRCKDIFVRYKRMRGFPHALASGDRPCRHCHAVRRREADQEGEDKSRHDLGRRSS